MKQDLQAFKNIIWDFYKKNGRHEMLWRKTTDPYYILISEIMLQQTQVDRVTEKYQEFITTFPTIKHLVEAPLSQVLAVWSGLGYNRRAKFLKQAAEKIINEHNETFPQTIEELTQLPGIGHATAAAILTYAYNKAIPYIETNIRTVFIFHFFPKAKDIHDEKIKTFIIETLDKENPREWHWALMDYGTHLKKLHGNFSKKSKHYTKQSKFEGSRRQKRSLIIKKLIEHKKLRKEELSKETNIPDKLLPELLTELQKEGMIIKNKNNYQLP
ncbi:MAG: hypothetical protein RL557_1038 [archaeon]|jgi:A/G-specific adenine glycosylase